MRLGDLLEIAGAMSFTAAAYLAWGLAPALVVAGVALVYEGQCYGANPLPRLKIRLPRLRKRAAE